MTTLDDEIDEILDPIVNGLRGTFLYQMNGYLTRVYIAGSTQVLEWGGREFEGPPMQEAIKYAEKHCATAVKGMDEETKRRLAQVISEGIENKRGIPGLAKDLRTTFGDMSKYRSEMIARTETADALQQAFIDRAKDMGIEGKELITGNPCPICADNEAAGVIPIDSVFPSGHGRPPFHPHCMCALVGATLKK